MLGVVSALLKTNSEKCKLTVDAGYKDRQAEDKVAERMFGFHPYQPVYQGSQTEMQHLIR